MAFLLDTNVFIKAKNEYLAFDISPGFWTWFEEEAKAQRVLSVEAVWNELEPQDDDLGEWVRSRRALFLRLDAAVVGSIQRVTSWAQLEQQYTAAAKIDFTANADSALVAHALSGGHTIVTHERPGPMSQARTKIPTAAANLGVECINPYLMMRRLRMSLAVQPRGGL